MTSKYRVTLAIDVEVDATDRQEARSKAIELAQSGTLDEGFRLHSGIERVEKVQDDD